jgi:peptidoglycan-associated lipoprotein
MVRRHVRWATSATIGVFGLALISVSCATVKPEELDAELAKVREEMRAGDDQLSSRIDALEGRVDKLEAELKSLRDDFNTTVERMQGMLKFNVPVHFAFDEAEIRELDKPVLDRFAAVVKEFYADAIITVEGFADPAGSEAYNIRLGKRRAEAVKQYLTTAGGLPADQVKTVSYGEAPDRQVVPGARGPGITGIENRRVALVVDYAGAVRGK